MQMSFAKNARGAVPLHAVRERDLKNWLSARPKREAAFLKNAGFAASEGDLRLVPDAQGAISSAVMGLGKGDGHSGVGAVFGIAAGRHLSLCGGA